jgi:hypothetical protein
MTIALNIVTPGNFSLDNAKTEVNNWKEDVVAVFDTKNGCVLFTPNFTYNGKYTACYSDNKGTFMDGIQLGNALKAKDIAFGVTIPTRVKELSVDTISPDFTIDPPLSQPDVTILTVKTPPSVTMLHVDRDVGTIAYKSGKSPNLVYNADKGWTVGNNDMIIMIIIALCICCCCCLGLAFFVL